VGRMGSFFEQPFDRSVDGATRHGPRPSGIRIDAPHLQNWIRAGRARSTSAVLSRTFACQLDAMSWSVDGTSLDWAALGGLAVRADDGDAVTEWLERVEPGASEAVFVLFSPDEPGLVCPMIDALTHLGFLFGPAPGPRFLCGAGVRGHDVDPRFDQVIEWDGTELHARARVADPG
jgi:hypothetical protein